MNSRLKRLARPAVPMALTAAAARPGASRRQRRAAIGTLLGYWTLVYVNYRRGNIARTRRERELLKSVRWEAFWRHYNEQVPTIEQEFDIWGEYHQHRHEMRYDLLAAAVREHLPRGGRIIDVGCGAGLVADRILDLDAHYVGFDFGEPHIQYAARKFTVTSQPLRLSFVRCDAERTPFGPGCADVVVMTEVIEHLIRPERAVWEVARLLKPQGVFIMTTNNASEVPLRSPLSHLFAWLEKAIGADVPSLISLRPWIWPEPVDRAFLPEGSPDVYLPHTHHIQGETRRMFAAAGLDTFRWSTFEFPPPQSATAQWLDGKGEAGRRAVDVIERIAQRTPLVKRLGTHVFMLARKTRDPVSPEPPPGVWPGPFSDGSSVSALHRQRRPDSVDGSVAPMSSTTPRGRGRASH